MEKNNQFLNKSYLELVKVDANKPIDNILMDIVNNSNMYIGSNENISEKIRETRNLLLSRNINLSLNPLAKYEAYRNVRSKGASVSEAIDHLQSMEENKTFNNIYY